MHLTGHLLRGITVLLAAPQILVPEGSRGQEAGLPLLTVESPVCSKMRFNKYLLFEERMRKLA